MSVTADISVASALGVALACGPVGYRCGARACWCRSSTIPHRTTCWCTVSSPCRLAFSRGGAPVALGPYGRHHRRLFWGRRCAVEFDQRAPSRTLDVGATVVGTVYAVSRWIVAGRIVGEVADGCVDGGAACFRVRWHALVTALVGKLLVCCSRLLVSTRTVIWRRASAWPVPAIRRCALRVRAPLVLRVLWCAAVLAVALAHLLLDVLGHGS